MKKLPINKRTATLLVVLLPLLLAFGYVVTNSGPLAPTPVTVMTVEKQSITPALFGIGTVEARYRYRVGPTMTGRLLSLNRDVGDQVIAGEILGEMDPIDMDDRVAANKAAIKRATASIAAAEAHVNDLAARTEYSGAQAKRYQQLTIDRNASTEAAEAKNQEYRVAKAGLAVAIATLNVAQQELEMLQAEHEGLLQQRSNLRLVAPVAGVITSRHIEPGSTAVAGQTILEIIDPKSIWINVRFNQLQSNGLIKGLPATIVLRSRSNQPASGTVARIELLADPVTEEMLAKVVFEQLPEPSPPIGELTEVTVLLPQLDVAPVVPNASIKQLDGQSGVWRVEGDRLQFTPIETGISDLDGRVQITKGLEVGDQVVVYSKQALTARSRITIVDSLVGSGS